MTLFNKHKKPVLYLHIGTHKTGTTSIQQFIFQNRLILKNDYNISYPNFPNNEDDNLKWANFAHHKLGWYFSNNNILKHTNIEIIENLLENIKQHNGDILLSSEVFLENCFSSDELNARFKTIKNTFYNHTIKPIIYLKRQDKAIESAYNETIKGTSYSDKIDIEKNYLFIYKYGKILDVLSNIFGKTNLIIRPFEVSQFINNDLFDDFLFTINIENATNFIITDKKTNVSFGREQNEIFRILNELSIENTKYNKLKQLLLLNTNNKAIKTYSLLSPKERMYILKKYDSDNIYIAHKYLHRRNKTLFYDALPDLKEEWKPINLNLNTTFFFEITQLLFDRWNKNI